MGTAREAIDVEVCKGVDEALQWAKKDKQVQRLTWAVTLLACIVGLLLAGNIALSLTTARLVDDNRLGNYVKDGVLVDRETQTPIDVHRAMEEGPSVDGNILCAYSVYQLARVKDFAFQMKDGSLRLLQISAFTLRAGEFVEFNTFTGELIQARPSNDTGITVLAADHTTVLVEPQVFHNGGRLLSRRELAGSGPPRLPTPIYY